MKRLGYWFAAACLLCAMWVEKPMYAQRPGQYTPSRGPLSPYFGLFQYNGSPLPNYQAFVKPRQEVVAGLRSDSRRIDRIEQQLRVRNTDAASGLMRRSESAAEASSRAADFLNLQPYYPLQQSFRSRR